MLAMVKVRKADVIPSYKRMIEGYSQAIRISSYDKKFITLCREKRDNCLDILNMMTLTDSETILLSDKALGYIIDDLYATQYDEKGSKQFTSMEV